ncbi:MAG: hypothetical protein KJ915_02990 [Candidatus Omnitrophica bacterium]|nr:hypothetical protein [Candidatus Omnitrophota bacterium]
MSKVYFFGAGATKAVASKAPLNEDLLNVALNNPSDYQELEQEIREVILFLGRIFHRNISTRPNLEDVLSMIDYNLKNTNFSVRQYNYDDLVNIRNNIVKII